MRVVFFGSGAFAVPCLRWLANSPHEMPLVVTQPDRPAGRGKKPMPTAVATAATDYGFQCEPSADVNDAAFVEKLAAIRADIGVVIAFGQKMLAPLRSAFPCECINLHASLLPKYRGAAPIPAAILAGEAETGVTVFRLVDRMDAGPMLVHRRTAIAPTETAGELHDRLARVGCDALDVALKMYEEHCSQSPPRRGTSRIPPGEQQNETQATWVPKLNKADGYLRFDAPAEMIARRCRAMWPWPGARCRYVAADGRSEEIAIATATVVPGSSNEPPGTITDILNVAASAGALEILSLQPAGKRLMGWRDFVNGRHVQPGDRLEKIGT